MAGDPQGQTQLPHWSPAGLLTFYDTSRAAFVALDPRNGEQASFPNETGQPGSWSPDGRFYVTPEITFLTTSASDLLPEVEDLAASHLLRFALAGGEPENLTQAENLEDTAPAYAPDGRQLAFARRYLDVQRWTPGRQLWLMPAGGTDARKITDEPYFNHYQFVWSPDGKRLAYMRFNQTVLTEPPEIWIFDLATGQTRRLVQGGYAPQWIPLPLPALRRPTFAYQT